jgi:hypothetical protein
MRRVTGYNFTGEKVNIERGNEGVCFYLDKDEIEDFCLKLKEIANEL